MLEIQEHNLPEAASPVNARPPPAKFDEFGQAMMNGKFGDEEALGASGNRWPRSETLALLKIRSEMDTAFRDATLKAPLWDEVSRKLAELGYKRSAKKCKEKFENVHKYYKRTKGGRAGRQDGKSYRFFTELEAFHAATPTTAAATTPASPSSISFSTVGPASGKAIQASPISAAVVKPVMELTPLIIANNTATNGGGLQEISAIAAAEINSSSFDSDDDEEGNEASQKSKRPRGGEEEEEGESGGRKKKMMAFFEGMMSKLMERQEAIQQQFLEAMEKREQERTARDEARRRQETARLRREQDQLAQERADRDNALISYLQRLAGVQQVPIQTPPLPSIASTNTTATPTPPSQIARPVAAAPAAVKPLQQHRPSLILAQQIEGESKEPQTSPSAEAMVASEQNEGMAPNRWPKAEVHALIQLRSGLESRYQEPGPKGPLWDEISAGMSRLGYSRSPKRCKEKWENINKYFKKVKESNKKRPEDAKTCPYYHQLDALYRRKQAAAGNGAGPSAGIQRQESEKMYVKFGAPERAEPISVKLPEPPVAIAERQSRNGSDFNGSNGGHSNTILAEEMKNPEDVVKEMMKQSHQQAMMERYENEGDSDTLDEDDDEDDEENGKLQYKIEFQRQNVGSNGGNPLAIVQ